MTVEWSNPKAVADRILHIELNAHPAPPFIPTRYPYTYAYDYIRSHNEEFGVPLATSRADCAGLFKDGPAKEEVVRLLADAYLREHGIIKTNG